MQKTWIFPWLTQVFTGIRNHKMKGTLSYTLLLLLATSTLKAQSIIDSKFGDGVSLMAKDSSFTMKFSFRMQNLFVAEKDLNTPGSPVETEAMVRRSRLKFDGIAFSPRVTYKAEIGLSNRDISGLLPQNSNAPNLLLDAVVKWEFIDNLELWIGQAKLPGNRERVVSSSSLQFVDRSLVNGAFNLDRDMGIQLHHDFKIGKAIIREKFALSKGEGRNITAATAGGFGYTGRIEILPLGKFADKGDYFESDLERGQKPKVMIGIGYDYNQDAHRAGGQLGQFLTEQRDLSTAFADLIFKYKGISLSSEYMNRTTTNPVLYDTTGDVTGAFYTGSGYVVQAGYLFKNNWEIAGRYTSVTPTNSIIDMPVKQYTLGISKYVVGHSLKVQTDVSLTQEGITSPDNQLMYRLQVELGL